MDCILDALQRLVDGLTKIQQLYICVYILKRKLVTPHLPKRSWHQKHSETVSADPSVYKSTLSFIFSYL